MAMAQANANYSDVKIRHSGQFNSIGENLAWNYGSDPFIQWYDEEKEEYENGNNNYNDIGHYLNIINPDWTTTGFAITTRGSARGWDIYGQTFSRSYNTENAMSVSEYKARFDEYYASVTTKPPGNSRRLRAYKSNKKTETAKTLFLKSMRIAGLEPVPPRED